MADRRGLNTRERRRVTAEVRRTESHCWLCLRPIDQRYNTQRHPLGFTVDEIIPRSLGGSAVDRANCRAAHRLCNSTRGTQPPSPALTASLARQIDEMTGTTGPQRASLLDL